MHRLRGINQEENVKALYTKKLQKIILTLLSLNLLRKKMETCEKEYL